MNKMTLKWVLFSVVLMAALVEWSAWEMMIYDGIMCRVVAFFWVLCEVLARVGGKVNGAIGTKLHAMKKEGQLTPIGSTPEEDWWDERRYSLHYTYLPENIYNDD